jgi:hypothetical protein
MSAEETKLKNLNELLHRATEILDQLEGWKKADMSPVMRERVLTLSQKSEKFAVEILARIEALEGSLKPNV